MKKTGKLILVPIGIALLLGLLSCAPAVVRYTSDEIAAYPADVQLNIREGFISFGMSPDEARYAWGSPHDIIFLPSTEDGKDIVEWDYSKYLGVITTRLTFTGGKLTQIISNDPEIKRR